MLNDVYEISQHTMGEIYDFSIASGGNVMIFGPSGIGKSEIAISAAIARDIKYVYINLSVLEAVDLIGLPKFGENVTTYATPEFLPLKDDNVKKVVLIIDEIDKAKDEIQNPLLELFQFHSINGKPLNIQSIIATGNLPNEHAKSRVISWALANRCNIYKVYCEFSYWRKWAVQQNINPLIVGFLGQRSDLLLKPNESGDPTAYCNPSPRSWTLAAKDIDDYESYVLQQPDKLKSDTDAIIDFESMLVAGRVGIQAAIDFKIWLKYYRYLSPDIDALIERGIFPNMDMMTMDHVMVFGIAGINALNKTCQTASPKIEKIINNVFGWLNSDQVTADQCFACIKSTLTIELIEKYDLLSFKLFEDVFDKIGSAIDLL